ncbi:hypothetical protein [Streptomyces sp. NPDC058989]|uniref:hypothetical protein n=1 Tax=Streptomyces sp. NPDC058989 TaxID=3346686 RepID=UPI0036AFC508
MAVSETLGHSDTRITRDIYQSVMPKAAREAAEATAAVVPRGAARSPKQAPDEATAEPQVEQGTQTALERLVAQIVEAATHDGRAVEDIAQQALEQLARQAAEAPVEAGALASRSQEGAKIIAFPSRRAQSKEKPRSDDVQPGLSLSRLRDSNPRPTHYELKIVHARWVHPMPPGRCLCRSAPGGIPSRLIP